MRIWAIATVAIAAALLAGGTRGADRPRERAGRPEPTPIRIGAVLNHLDDPFFVAIYEGLRVEAGRIGARLTVRSVTSNAELAGQGAQLRALVRQDNDCYVVNPITGTNLVEALRGIRRPIINVDSPVDRVAAERADVRIRSYIGTDDVASGRRAGAEMAALLPGGGDVALIGGIAGNVNSGRRLSGFERGIQGSRLRVVARVNAGFDRTKAEIAAERILREQPRLAGVFAVSDSMVLGVADALRGLGRTGGVTVVGHDGTAAALHQIQGGSIDADVSQYPYVMGQMAVDACVAAARGERLPQRVHTPIAVLTKGSFARAVAAFPKPFRPYSNPFTALLRR
jgi:ABC-type sugar transport system substrate-binding protein